MNVARSPKNVCLIAANDKNDIIIQISDTENTITIRWHWALQAQTINRYQISCTFLQYLRGEKKSLGTVIRRFSSKGKKSVKFLILDPFFANPRSQPYWENKLFLYNLFQGMQDVNCGENCMQDKIIQIILGAYKLMNMVSYRVMSL